jgi:hypothetical protein
MHSTGRTLIGLAILASCISLATPAAASESPGPSIRDDQRSQGLALQPAAASVTNPPWGWARTGIRSLVLLSPRYLSPPKKRPPAKPRPNWDAIARCESGGRWHYNGPSGFDGGLQFLPSTWTAVMKRMHPWWRTRYAWQATRARQIAAAEYLIGPMGANPWRQWPYCWRFAWKRG